MLALALALAAQLADPHAHDAAAPTTGKDGRLKILVMDLAAEGAVDPGTVQTLTGIISAELAGYLALDVMANADVRRMLELEGQKQSVGCGDSSCLADIAGAMGARLVVFGSLGKLGDSLVVHLNLYDSDKATSVGRQFVEAKDVAELPKLLRPKLRALLERIFQEEGLVMPPAPPEEPTTPPPPPPKKPKDPGIVPWVVMGGGAVAIVGGAAAAAYTSQQYFAYQAFLDEFQANDDDVDVAGKARRNAQVQADAWNDYGMITTIVGGSLVGAGVIAVGVGGAMLLFPGEE